MTSADVSAPARARRLWAGVIGVGTACLGWFVLAATALASTPAAAVEISSELKELSRRIAENRSAANFESLQVFANRASGTEKAFARYAIGMARYEEKDYAEAEKVLSEVIGSLGLLDHYAAYYRVRCIVLSEDFERALGPLERFGSQHPDSRFRPAVERLRVESLLRLREWDRVRPLVAQERSLLEEPVRLYLAGRVEHLEGNLKAAVSLYRQAYYRFPLSDQADASEAQLDRLRSRMGKAYPVAPAPWRLERAQKLHVARSYERASAEFGRALAAGLQGVERELAVVRKAASDYSLRRTSSAYRSLAKLSPKDPELGSERLYWLTALERRLGLVGPMLSSVEKLSKQHAASPWYEEALLSVGNYYYLKDDRREYPRWFRRLAQTFPTGKHAPYAHWKVCWREWLDDGRDRGRLFAEHVRRFPAAPTAAGALYWLGRLREEEGRPLEAQSYYRAVTDAFPHYYYGVLAGKRLAGNAVAAPQEIVNRLPKPRQLASVPTSETRAFLEVGGLLAALGFADDAALELHRVDYRKADSHLAGVELARLHTSREEHFRALRAMKRYAFGYLRMPFEALDLESWHYLFPIGWEERLRTRSERHHLDPYLVAALIRQESEFNAGARSHAGALGLMQIMPATGRQLFRRLGIPGFSSRKLTVPDISLRLGTFHLKEVLAQFDGELEKGLAGYNAGERRIPGWMQLGPFEDSTEFVETIPFSETRGYVQSIVRNRALYSRIYGGQGKVAAALAR